MQPKHYLSLTWQERKAVREQYVEAQQGRCYYCGGLLSEDPVSHVMGLDINWRLFPSNFLKYPVHLHHSHTTGMTLGAVHARCNAVLWQYHGE